MVNMKKISMIALTILTLGVTSCDMDKMPYDAVPTEEALTTIVGFEEARAGIYSVYLGLTGGSYVLAPEVQADAFNAVADFSNKYGELHRWTFESTNSTVETIWSNYYAAIALNLTDTGTLVLQSNGFGSFIKKDKIFWHLPYQQYRAYQTI